jgi:hypothetical protein
MTGVINHAFLYLTLSHERGRRYRYFFVLDNRWSTNKRGGLGVTSARLQKEILEQPTGTQPFQPTSLQKSTQSRQSKPGYNFSRKYFKLRMKYAVIDWQAFKLISALSHTRQSTHANQE